MGFNSTFKELNCIQGRDILFLQHFTLLEYQHWSSILYHCDTHY